MKVEEIVQKLLNGETVDRKHFTANNLNLIKFRLEQIRSDCATVLKQIKEIKDD